MSKTSAPFYFSYQFEAPHTMLVETSVVEDRDIGFEPILRVLGQLVELSGQICLDAFALAVRPVEEFQISKKP